MSVDSLVPEQRREPAAFASVLAAKEPLLLVGGQAVNLWALYYGERTADLAPFVSHDVDVLGDPSDPCANRVLGERKGSILSHATAHQRSRGGHGRGYSRKFAAGGSTQ